MLILRPLISRIYGSIVEMRPWFLLLVLICYLAISWTLFFLAGEDALVESPITFVYFASTVASTVGFGDLSPVTNAGRLIAVFWLYPCSLLIYSLVLAKITSIIIERIGRMAKGLGDYSNVKGASVIVGYHEDRTKRMVEDMIAGQDGDRDIILVAVKENVIVPDGVRFVRTERLDALDSLRRAGVENAEKTLVYADTDGETFNACLAVRELNPSVHVAAYFQDADTARRAAKHAGVETVVSNSAELLVRAAQDPGASKVLLALSSAAVDSTVYMATLREDGLATERLSQMLARENATVLAVKTSRDRDVAPQFRPFPEFLEKGATIYYVAAARLSDLVWGKIEGAGVEAGHV